MSANYILRDDSIFSYRSITSSKYEVLAGNIKPIAYIMRKTKMDRWHLIVTADSMLNDEALWELAKVLRGLNLGQEI